VAIKIGGEEKILDVAFAYRKKTVPKECRVTRTHKCNEQDAPR
jgi:hypothetical protein